jgi:hypothetical protein
MSEDLKYIHQIRDQYYHIEIWLYNQIEGQEPFLVPFFFVNSLAIEETLMNWPTKGWIVLKNDYEMFERGALATIKNKEADRPKVDAPYIFRSDGRNRISIKIYPVNKKPLKDNAREIAGDLPPDLWEMNYDFVVYDIEDLPTEDPQRKLRKLYFQDERLQIMSERNLEWSTSLYGPNNGNSSTKDIQRTMPANLALKSIISAAASKDSNPNNADMKVGYDSSGSIKDPNIKFDNFGEWDEGPSSIMTNDLGTNILYTSPANSNALQDLNYVYNNAVGKDGSPVILDFGRWTEDKKWHLRPLSSYFKNAEDNQIERLLLEDGLDATTSPPYIARAPDGNGSDTKNFISGIASRIKKYKFAPMVSSDDARITNRPVYNYDFSKGQFNSYFKGNRAEDVSTKLQDLAKEGLYAYNQKDSQQILLNINKTKSTGLMTTNYFTPQTFFPKNKTSLSMIKDALFLNEALYFQAPGLTFRTPGKFIFVDRTTSSDRNPFDDRFLGQWLMTRVVHLFTQDKYLCDVVAVKVDSFSKLWDHMDTKY